MANRITFLDPCLKTDRPPRTVELPRPSPAITSEWRHRLVAVLGRCHEEMVSALSFPPLAIANEEERHVHLWRAIHISIAADGRYMTCDVVNSDPAASAPRFSAELDEPIGPTSWMPAFDALLLRACRESGLDPASLPPTAARWMRKLLKLKFEHLVDFRTLRRVVRGFLAPDPLVSSLTHRVFNGYAGYTASAGDFNWVADHEREIALAAIERPRVLPFLRLARSHDAAGDAVAATVELLLEAGMAPGALRALDRWGYAPFDQALDSCPFMDETQVIAEYANLLHRLGLKDAPPEIFTRLAAWAGTFEHARMGERLLGDAIPDWYLRALLDQIRYIRDRTGDECEPGDFHDTLWWLAREDRIEPDSNQRRAGWRWIVSETKKAAQIRDDEPAPAWEVPCGEIVNGNLRIVPLASPGELDNEARALRNCLSSYAEACMLGDLSIFSVRNATSGERVACFSVKRTCGEGSVARWKLGSMAGKCNQPAPAPVPTLAREVVERLNGQPARIRKA